MCVSPRQLRSGVPVFAVVRNRVYAAGGCGAEAPCGEGMLCSLIDTGHSRHQGG